jgi:nicotinamide-nucleotide amidase
VKRAVLLAIGDELLSGSRRDINCSWLASKFADAGWEVRKIEFLPDENAPIVQALDHWAGQTEIVVLSGGLGPTHDDKTRQALADFLSVPLIIDHKAYNKIAERYNPAEQEGIERSRSTQGAIPEGTTAVHNSKGSALGISFHHKQTVFFSFPGVPDEFQKMAEECVIPILQNEFTSRRSFFVTGWAESLLKDHLASVFKRRDLHISILPSVNLIELALSGEESIVNEVASDILSLLPHDCLPSGCRSLPEAIYYEATKKNLSVSAAESCTGGMIGAALTGISGVSKVFYGSAVCYSNDAKKDLLAVPSFIIEKYGAVSSECAVVMAERAQKMFKTDIAISVTGIAGPDGATADKPVGMVWFGLASSEHSCSFRKFFSGDRDRVRKRATAVALEYLWRSLKGEEIVCPYS